MFFLQQPIFTNLVGAITPNMRCETFCSSLWFGSSESSVIREGKGASRMPSFMPHFLRKPDCKHSTTSLPLQDKTQSNNIEAADANPSLCRHFCSSFVVPVPSTSRMESDSQTTPASDTQRHKHSQDFSTACTSMAVLLTPILLLPKWIRMTQNAFLTRETFTQVK